MTIAYGPVLHRHPYHMSLHHDLPGVDFQNRRSFYQRAREQTQTPNFRKILHIFSVEFESTKKNRGYYSKFEKLAPAHLQEGGTNFSTLVFPLRND